MRKALKGKFRQSGIKFPQFGHTVGMGKKIDALVAVLLGTLAAYGFFLAATEHVPAPLPGCAKAARERAGVVRSIG